MIPDINSFWEFLGYYSVGGFVGARHMAGLAHEKGCEELEAYRSRRYNGGQYEPEAYRSRRYNGGQYEPEPGTRAFFAFIGGFIAWPVVYAGWTLVKAIENTPARVWSVLKYVFVKPPPKRIRKERKLAELQERTAKLERELELAD